MVNTTIWLAGLAVGCVLHAMPGDLTMPSPQKSKSVIVYPWSFDKGTDTARKTAISTAEEICQKKGFAILPRDVGDRAFKSLRLPLPSGDYQPTTTELSKFGKHVGADYVLTGDTKWHTRSIWVGAGPKTISTATVNLRIIAVKSGKVTFEKKKIEGRSDERDQTLKLIGAVLISPLVTAVSGGPKTPQEQRAVQISLARALEGWKE